MTCRTHGPTNFLSACPYCLQDDIDKLKADLAEARATITEMEAGYGRAARMIVGLKADLAAALELRQKGCDCNDDDACRFARERDAALADLAAARADAARYRWIRDNHEVRGRAMEIVYGMNGSDWDAAIDAALAGEKK